ncbi:uncharacterized protein LOC141642516 [Silene latifolia]|uniref:uncharacterized protein LOC141642516 n=1 Tax=Silene latifolia TaxID=37657 RepID=UPI003D773D79
MSSAKETGRKTPDAEVDKTNKGPRRVEMSDDSECDANKESGNDDEESKPTWMTKSDAKLKALTDVHVKTRELVRCLSRGEFFAELDGRDQARAAREEARISKSLDIGDPEEREDSLAPEVPAPSEIKEDVNPNINEESSKTGGGSKITPSSAQGMAGASSAQGPVKEEEIRAVLLQRSPLTTSELVATFKATLKSPENKKAFADILKRISKIHKMNNNQNYVVLRKDVKEKEIRPVLLQRSPLTTSELVATFKAILKPFEDKKAFAKKLKRILKLQKTNTYQNYVVLSKLSKSGKELKKLFGRSNGLNDSDGHNEDGGSSKRKLVPLIAKLHCRKGFVICQDDEGRPSPVSAPKLKDLKEGANDSSPAKSAAGKFSPGTRHSKFANGKRNNGDDTKPASGSALKKIKSESDGKPNTKDESSKTGGCSKITPSSAQGMAGASSAQGPVKEEEIRAVLLQRSPLTISELVATFKARLKSPEDKKAFADILKRITKLQKTNNNQKYIVLRK